MDLATSVIALMLLITNVADNGYADYKAVGNSGPMSSEMCLTMAYAHNSSYELEAGNVMLVCVPLILTDTPKPSPQLTEPTGV